MKETKQKRIRDSLSHLPLGPKENMLQYYNLESGKKIAKKIQANSLTNDEKNTLINASIYYKIDEVLEYIALSFNEIFTRLHYIAPLRADAQRYYPYVNIRVAEIEKTGANSAMLLSELSDNNRINDLNNWVDNLFGFSIETVDFGGHRSINIKFKGTNELINIVDLGFGFSQLLPIILQLWLLTDNANYEDDILLPEIILIEQPELHLHPEYQSKLTDVFITTIRECSIKNIDIRFIIETHSETIINRIGYNIYKNNISENQVGINIFDSIESCKSNIIHTGFNENGRIKKWPIGFFDSNY